MSWLFSRALVEEFLADSSSATKPSAPWKLIPSADAYLSSARTTELYHLSRYGMTFATLTPDLGEELLTWYLAAFR
jgi:hypothetical protein